MSPMSPTSPTSASPPSPDLDDDDRLIGRLLSRREVLLVTGGIGTAAFMAACTTGAASPIASAIATATGSAATPGATAGPTAAAATGTAATPTATAGATPTAAASLVATPMPTCLATPEAVEGPYFVEEGLNRSDIRTDPSNGTTRPGATLVLSFVISRVSGSSCTAWHGAAVDVWHCDAAGQYSDVTDRGFSTLGQKWLRGYQMTDASGVATFTTIYPGWYSGRAVHIHFKVRTVPAATSGLEFTSQLFFDDAQNQAVFANAPYSAKGTVPDVLNGADGIYRGTGGQTLLVAAPAGDGYAATIGIGIQA
jgi:protocatechuate 3,4-dioxygenase beta subunit